MREHHGKCYCGAVEFAVSGETVAMAIATANPAVIGRTPRSADEPSRGANGSIVIAPSVRRGC
jgi:hypothetical protein